MFCVQIYPTMYDHTDTRMMPQSTSFSNRKFRKTGLILYLHEDVQTRTANDIRIRKHYCNSGGRQTHNKLIKYTFFSKCIPRLCIILHYIAYLRIPLAYRIIFILHVTVKFVTFVRVRAYFVNIRSDNLTRLNNSRT